MSKQAKRLADFQSQLESVQAQKDAAVQDIRSGLYPAAIEKLTATLRTLDSIQAQLHHPGDLNHVVTLRSTLLSNISLSYMQQSEYAKVIELCTLILQQETLLLTTSKDLLIKTYLRRALAYEATEKLVRSKQDFT